MWIFNDIFKSTIWGGNRIALYKRVATDKKQIGESWEISAVPGTVSVVATGPDKGMTLPELLERDKEKLVGKGNYQRFGNRFPLLVKFIDAADDLSVQVHPDDRMARRLGYPNGKTEMWYIVNTHDTARLGLGFKSPINPSEYEYLVSTGKIEDTLRFHEVHPGEVYIIPAGRVHAIGKGCFIAEIQQTSDITYRLYDYRRKGADGRERQLHTDKALEAIDFNDTDSAPIDYKVGESGCRKIVCTPYFSTDIVTAETTVELDYSTLDSFVILMGIEGGAKIKCRDNDTDGKNSVQEIDINAGQTILIPATAKSLTIIPMTRFTCLTTFIE